MSTRDPWLDRLSEYVDGELAPAEAAACEAHLAGCAECRKLQDDLRRLAGEVRALAPRPPARDLWPGIAGELRRAGRTSSRAAWLLAFAAGVLATLGAVLAYRLVIRGVPAEPELVASAGEDYLLLLHEPAGFGSEIDPSEHAAIVARYARWAADLGARCTGGEELEAEGLALRPGVAEPAPTPAGERVGGYFLLSVRDWAEAVGLARTCPHLEQGGWIELRRIARADHVSER